MRLTEVIFKLRGLESSHVLSQPPPVGIKALTMSKWTQLNPKTILMTHFGEKWRLTYFFTNKNMTHVSLRTLKARLLIKTGYLQMPQFKFKMILSMLWSSREMCLKIDLPPMFLSCHLCHDYFQPRATELPQNLIEIRNPRRWLDSAELLSRTILMHVINHKEKFLFWNK